MQTIILLRHVFSGQLNFLPNCKLMADWWGFKSSLSGNIGLQVQGNEDPFSLPLMLIKAKIEHLSYQQ
jgi:hypothetical protein